MTTASPTLDETFAALADPTRRAILERLMAGEASVAELTEPFAMSQPAISKHLKYLERAGLVSRHREAQRRMCRLEAAPMAEAVAWLEGYRRFWEASYARLDALLERMKAAEQADEADEVPGVVGVPGAGTSSPSPSEPGTSGPDDRPSEYSA